MIADARCETCGAPVEIEQAGYHYKPLAPGPATLAMVAKIAAEVKYEEDRQARIPGTGAVEDEDESSLWFTIGEARAFIAEHAPAKELS